LLIRVGVSLVVAAVIVFCIVLPAEFHLDPTGFGTLTGLMALSAPPPVEPLAAEGLGSTAPEGAPARAYGVPFRTDEVMIPLGVDEELEYKVRMQTGGTLVYSWEVDNGFVYYDFHGERFEDPATAHSYAGDITDRLNGSLVAPFAGTHGWFLQNQEDHPVVVRLRMSGYYELRELPPGSP
jgi:hypothetical protein